MCIYVYANKFRLWSLKPKTVMIHQSVEVMVTTKYVTISWNRIEDNKSQCELLVTLS